MLRNENIICISSIDWDFIWQGHQEIMSALAKNGNRILFIENTGVRAPGLRDIPRLLHRLKNWSKGVRGIRREGGNIYIFSPVLLPFPYFRIARFLNRRLILSALRRVTFALDFSNPIIWTFLPTPLSLDMINNLAKKLVIYYCIDNFRASSASAYRIGRSEAVLLRKVDLVFVTSRELYNYCASYNNKVHLFPFAVNFEKFEEKRLGAETALPEMEDIKKPIIGYVGGIHKWIDQKLVKDAAVRHKDFSFVFIGPIQTDISLLTGLKNIYFLGKQEHEKIPLFIKKFDACIIPYSITDYTKNVYPTKLSEYLAMGKPVVSTPLPEIIEFTNKNLHTAYIAQDTKQFGDYIEAALSENNDSLEKVRINVARENSWDKTIQRMSILIQEEIGRKRLDLKNRWEEALVNFYRTAHRKTVKLATTCLLAYFVIFRTQFIWFLAEPLRIDNPPRKADAIVVFGGGVGETGNPGKSTIERARYAASLYKDKVADKIIFSSGYAYIYNDAENMRLISLSVGVADKDILLEQKANSAYENVVFSGAILSKNNWKTIILISSPYNMRRLSFVFKKSYPDIDVIYTPVKKCQFYDKYDYLTLEQIRAIMHEYLGIIYYWLKGRI